MGDLLDKHFNVDRADLWQLALAVLSIAVGFWLLTS